MNTFVWIVQIALAVFFLMPGFTKLLTPRLKLMEKGMVKPDGPVLPIRLLGLVEVLGSIGIILPLWLGILPILTPLAAVGFCIVMVGAIPVHLAKKEYKIQPLLLLIFALSALVAWYRF